MKKSLVLAMAMALGVTASAYAANPFSDVPAGHWAYDSISKLADAGVIEGYGDTTFGGDKLMTRYEMAQIVAKAMARGANVDRLAAEFADELDSLGVRVANLEKKADNVKITGQIRYNYAENGGDVEGYGSGLRTRLWVNGQINDNWTYTGMLQNVQNLKNDKGDETTDFQRAYVNGRVGGLKVQAGRYSFTDFNGGNIYDTRFDGVQVAYGKDVKLTAGYGKANPKSSDVMTFAKDNLGNDYGDNISDKVFYADLSGKLGALQLNASYYQFKDVAGIEDLDDKIWSVGAAYNFDKNVKLDAVYMKSNAEVDGYDVNDAADLDDDGFVVGLSYKGAKASQAGSWGIGAKYYDQGRTTYLAHTMNGLANSAYTGFKGYQVYANYAFAKNIVGQVEYYDLEDKELDYKGRTLWSQLVFTF